MPKKKVTTKPKQTKSPKESRGAKMRDIERKIMQSSKEEVKEIFGGESAMQLDESMFESDDGENDSQPRIDEDLESPSSEEEDKKDTDEGEDESESDEDEAETKYEDSDEEIESESYCLSNSSYTESFHSEGLSRSSSSSNKKSDRASTKVHSTKSNSSSGTRRRDNDDNLNHRLSIARDLPTLAGIIMICIFLLLVIIIIGLLVYSNNKVKSGSSRRGETGSSFSAKSGQLTESYSEERGKKQTQRGFSNNCGSISSSLPFLLGSRETVYKNLINVQPEAVKCYTWLTFLSLKISMFWKSCNNPKHLFSNNNLFAPLPSLSSVILKKWTSKAELVTFEIQLLDAIEVQGIALHLEEFQVQYYLRNNLSVQLYGNYYRKSGDNHHDDTKYYHYSDNRNPILLFDEKLTNQHLVDGDTGKQHILITLFLCQQNKEKFSSLSLRLRSKSTILHQIISIEVLELKTYNQNR